jgi:hypothetical protein
MSDRLLIEVLDVCGLRGPSWRPWRVVAKTLDCLPLDPEELALFRTSTGRQRPPTKPPSEIFLICGRRSGKSRFAGALAVHAAGFRSYKLAPGESAIIAVSAADREQARLVLDYSCVPFRNNAELRPLVQARSGWEALRRLVSREHRWGLELHSGTKIEVTTSGFRSIRGRSFALAVCDELAYWPVDESGANPSEEVLRAVRPGLATLKGRLVAITSPYLKAGPVWDAYSTSFGVEESPVLVWRAASRVMNPTLDQSVIDEALRRDEVAARSEWLCEFRDDVLALLTTDGLAAVIDPGRRMLDPNPDHTYGMFVDSATGSEGGDSFTAAIAHREIRHGVPIVVVDGIFEAVPPFSPRAVVEELAMLAQCYGCRTVHGDAFAQGFTGALFQPHGIRYEVCGLSKSEIYLNALSMINSQLVSFPDEPKLIAQLQALQRRPASAGRESVDHPMRAHMHDDVANAVCGAAALVHQGMVRAPMRIL